MLILTLKILGVIPDEYPDTCECGFLFDTSGNDNKLTTITCTNPYCPVTSQFTIVEMLEKLGIKANLGEERAGTIIDHILQNPQIPYKCCMDLLGLTLDDVYTFPNSVISPIIMFRNKVEEMNNSGGIVLPLYMSLWCFSGLGETYCNRIFSTYTTIEDFYKDFLIYNGDKLDVDRCKYFIARFLNQSSSTATVNNIFNILIENHDELLRCAKYFKFKTVSKQVLQICITGEITRVRRDDGTMFKPRDTFAQYLRDKYNVNVVLNKAYSNVVDFVVCDNPSASRKANAAKSATRKDVFAQKLINEGINPGNRLITSEELVNIIKEGV